MKNTQQDIQENQLKRGLTNRHIQLIALGGSIGTGLFLGIGPAAVLAGPSVILGYAIAGIIAFFIMRQLGEMVVEEPVSGSFSHFAYKYCGSFAGFASGWNYWILYILVSMAELTAIGVYVQFWWPGIPLWASSLFFFLVINALNFASVKVYGETEFWFSIIKVVAIIAMILFGTYLLISGTGGEHATIHNLYNDGGFFPKGFFKKTTDGSFQGLLAAMALIMFSFGGLELIGITAAEAENPEKNIPKATNQVIYRILIFYVGALIILFALSPWQQITTDSSPFVMVFQNLNGMEFELFGNKIFFTRLIANVLNLIVLTAALSVYNSSVYSNSRMLYGLADQGNAPKFLMKLNKHSVPINAILISSCFAAICILINKVMPKEAFSILMSLVVSSLIINWVMISYTHLRFRRSKDKENTKTKFPSLFYPLSNYICFVFLLGILSIMWITDMKLSVELIPIWLGILFVCYKVFKTKK
ncbi:aromatic amino acid:proton symporter (AAT family) [Flavobacterium araucananum]|uniref:Aromatic amino acid transporter AroP n=1 Tax=Flavobacterium araucananum TaxID=946678 RepID=A0A227PDG8_9FLAO|nr:amino acid permease [Flavobacterium araucananum]OXG07095.1 aromatic amino acid transporter AroP [Flavobacterium araucananum]PWK01369.1 aromatic amino acid:proton symporter (AAT family) [Flavobacterium araucananum]